MSESESQQLTDQQDRQWATVSHFAGILGFVPPLIIWLVFRARGTVTATEAKESTNFQITVNSVVLVLWVLSFALVATPLGLVLPFVALAVYIVALILVFRAGFTVQGGGSYRYPVSLRLLK